MFRELYIILLLLLLVGVLDKKENDESDMTHLLAIITNTNQK